MNHSYSTIKIILNIRIGLRRNIPYLLNTYKDSIKLEVVQFGFSAPKKIAKSTSRDKFWSLYKFLMLLLCHRTKKKKKKKTSSSSWNCAAFSPTIERYRRSSFVNCFAYFTINKRHSCRDVCNRKCTQPISKPRRHNGVNRNLKKKKIPYRIQSVFEIFYDVWIISICIQK